MSLLRGYPPVLLGEGVELFSVPVPAIARRTPAARLRHRLANGPQRRRAADNDQLTAPLTSETVLAAGAELVMLGSHEQRAAFIDAFGK